MEENQKTVQNIGNMFGAKPHHNPAHPNNMQSSANYQNTSTNVFRLNDYDNKILEGNAYMGIDDDVMKLEIKIADKENFLNNIKEKIRTAEKTESLQEVLSLKLKEKNLEIELSELKQQYSQRGLSSKIAGKLSKTPEKNKENIIIKIQKFLSRKVLPKFSKKVDSIMSMSESLETLKSINSNVDELITMKVPYGETVQNYEKLTAYLTRANKIHSQINKSMNNIKNKETRSNQ